MWMAPETYQTKRIYVFFLKKKMCENIAIIKIKGILDKK